MLRRSLESHICHNPFHLLWGTMNYIFLSPSVARIGGVSDRVYDLGNSLNTGSVGTNPSGPSVLYIDLSAAASARLGLAFGWSTMILR